jgi:electron-transferring-flavoprotein dehydrogenase
LSGKDNNDNGSGSGAGKANDTAIQRESMACDVAIVGAGPAGLASAIRLKQMARDNHVEISVIVLEKGAEVGAHILSGAVLDPRSLTELLPDWRAQGAPVEVAVTEDKFLFLSAGAAHAIPNWLLPGNFKNHGNYVISLANLTRWLGQQAEALGVDIFPGFPASRLLLDDKGGAPGKVRGVVCGDMGIGRDGKPTGNFQPGIEIHARYTLFCEGARGHLGRQLVERFHLRESADPQVHGLGLKEVWQLDPARHKPGLVIHTAGWPLQRDTYGGSFLYHMDNHQAMVGFVVGLGYTNPYLSPYEEFQRYKTHPAIRAYLEGGKRIAYGARAIAAGGLMSLPKLVFPGGALVGCDAGFLNASRIKGSHAAIKSGMLAAEAAFEALQAGRAGDTLDAYPRAFEQSWLHTELKRARNFKQWMSKGLLTGTLMTGIEQKLLGGHVPWTLHHRHADHETLKPADQCRRIDYPAPDGKLSFDRLSSVFLSGVNHTEDQPSHLMLKDAAIPVDVNLARYAGPESRYCPAGVYEFIKNEDGADRLQINAQNCVHCKTCDIKDPSQNIVWVPPEGGGGPIYPNT